MLDITWLADANFRALTPKIVFVKEKWRGSGVATLLVDRCEVEAKRISVKTLYLSTEFATKLYAKLGWEIIKRCQYRGAELDVMCKNLSS